MSKPQEPLLKSQFLYNQKQLSESRKTDHHREPYFSHESHGASYIHYYITPTQKFSPLFLSLLPFHPSTSQSTILHIIKHFCHSFSVESFLLSLSSENAKYNFLTVCYWFNGNYIFTKHQHTHTYKQLQAQLPNILISENFKEHHL